MEASNSPGGADGQLTPEKVFRDHAPRIFNLARRLLGNDTDAEDVTQDVLLQMVRKLDTFRGESSFPTWLHRVTVNAALEHRRKRAQAEAGREPDPFGQFLDRQDLPQPARGWSLSAAQQALDRETHQVIEDAIAAMPENYRDIFVLADVEGLPNAEIAQILGMNLQTVKNRLHRGRLWLRKTLASHFEEVAAS